MFERLQSKQWWLDTAEVLDAWRVFPRLMLLFYCYFVYVSTFDVLDWYQKLPGPERSLEASGLAAAIITAVTGMGTWFLKVYVSTGRKWDEDTSSA